MKKVLISQRRDPVDNRDEVRDGMDVRFASMVYDMGFLPIPLCSDLYNAEGYLEALQPDGILITGGNDIGEQPKRDMLEIRLLDYAKDQKIPVFGICRGTQIINHYLGGTTLPVNGHVATNHTLLGDWAERKGYLSVNSYHNFSITQESIAKELEILAFTEDGVIEALKHKELPWMGIMWHPERELSLQLIDKELLTQHLNN